MGSPPAGRVDWVDYAKGFCIVMVVMMHSTFGVETAVGHDGWLHALVSFARPFRMPDFFLISGLFLARVIDRDWRDYLDRKVLHFAYFYLLWVAIQFAFKAPLILNDWNWTAEGWAQVGWSYLETFYEPFGTLWFIYLLPIFFVATKAARGVPVWAMWLVLAALEIAHIETGWTAIDEFASRFVYFYTGYILAPRIFAFTAAVQARPVAGLVGLMLWGFFNAAVVIAGYSQMPFVSLGLGLIGAGAVITAAGLMAMSDVFRPLRYCGRNSIVIYLAFFLPMAAARSLLLKTGIVPDISTVCVLVTAAGVSGALCWFWAVRGTPFRFLFERPTWARLKAPRTASLQPAE